jgi:hypothetical protein
LLMYAPTGREVWWLRYMGLKFVGSKRRVGAKSDAYIAYSKCMVHIAYSECMVHIAYSECMVHIPYSECMVHIPLYKCI